MMARFHGLIYDMGDIFFDVTPWRHWLTGELQSQGIAITYPELVARWEALLVDVYKGRAVYWERFNQLLTSLGLHGAIIEPLTEAARAKGQAVQKKRPLFVGVSDTLAVLQAAGIQQAVLSDTESSEKKVRQRLKKLGIECYFDAVVTSRDIGYVKPEPEAYYEAARRLELPLDQCAFIGHDTEELEGAQAIGLFAIAFNYEPGAPADLYFDHFRELGDWVLKA